MPTDVPLSPTVLVAYVLQGLLFFTGLVVFWREGLSAEARGRPARLATWTISGTDFALATICVLGGGFIAQVLAAQFIEFTPNDDFSLLLFGAALQFGFLFGAVYTGLKFNTTLPAPDAPRPGSAWHDGVLAFVAIVPLASLIAFAWSLALDTLGIEADPQELVDLVARLDSPGAVLGIVFLAAVVAPVTEELVFRAGLFRFLRTRIPRGLALAASSIVFGAIHFNLASFVPLAAIGLLLALAYERTGKIAVPIVAHGLFNLNTLLVLLAGVPPA